MRHKYNIPACPARSKNASSVQCINCGVIRQYVGGKATYFIRDTVYHKAPDCKKLTTNTLG